MKRVIAFITLSTLSAAAFAADFTKADICKATIAVEMGRDSGAMKAGKPGGSETTISYVRANDGKTFKYKCRITSETVVWATYFDDTKSWGRWRDRYAEGDAQTTYKLADNKLVVSNDQSGEQVFEKKDF